MINIKSLKLLKDALQKQGFECKEINEKDRNLKVLLENDSQNREWILALYPKSMDLLPNQDAHQVEFLQLLLSFPYKCEPDNSASVARLILLLNKGLPLPGFGFSETENLVYFSHFIYCQNGLIPRKLIVSMIGYLLLYVDSLNPMIEAIASGEKELHEIFDTPVHA